MFGQILHHLDHVQARISPHRTPPVNQTLSRNHVIWLHLIINSGYSWSHDWHVAMTHTGLFTCIITINSDDVKKFAVRKYTSNPQPYVMVSLPTRLYCSTRRALQRCQRHQPLIIWTKNVKKWLQHQFTLWNESEHIFSTKFNYEAYKIITCSK